MTSIEITIDGARAKATKEGLLTCGMVGVPVTFVFDEHWEGLNIIPVFNCGEITKDNVLVNNRTTIPYEVLQNAGKDLRIGAEGRSEDGRLVIPTVWVSVGYVQDGAKATGDIGLEPTPSQFDRFMGEIRKIDDKVIRAVEDAVASGVLKGEKGEPGTDGKTAYAYAKDGGYTGTEEEFSAKLASESANVYVGTEAPTDENVNVWIDTNEEAESGGVDVTAEVGQTVVVEEVDENGKPTKWKAADYQPRTHYEEISEAFHETIVDTTGNTLYNFVLEAGMNYKVTWNGVEYTNLAVDGGQYNEFAAGMVVLGNASLSNLGDDSGEPFIIIYSTDNAYSVIMGNDGESATCKIEKLTVYKLPSKFIPTPDWNAAEGEPGHVLNRTHWAEVVDVELLPEQEFTFAEGVAYTPEMIPLEVGKTYKVFFDGVLYNCTAYYSVFMDMQTVTIGNGNIYGFPVGSDEPFAIATVSSAGMSGIMCTDTASHTVKVAEEVEEVHALPKKFIPLSFPLYAHIEIGMIDVKPSEIAEALENSRVVIAIENGTCYQLKSNTGASVIFWGLDGGKIRTITFLVDVNRDTFVSATNHYYLLEPIPDQ